VLLSFCLVHAGSMTLLSENFEGAAAGWTLSGDWQVGTPSYVGPVTVPQGTRCAATNISGNYSNYSLSSLTTPLIQLPSTATQITLSFYEWYYLEACCDYMYLELSTNGGATWNTLRSGLNGSNQVWAQRTFDLTSYKSNTVQIRFRFTSDGSGTYPGWYVDSVTLVATVIDTANLPRIAVAPGSMRINAGDPPTKTLTICNTGIRDTLQYSFSTASAGSVKIVAWTYGADLTGEYANTVTAIMTRIPSATITATTTTDPTTLASLLQGAGVFLIPESDVIVPSASMGAAFASVLDSYVNAGGIVIVLSPYADTAFLAGAGLERISYRYSTTSGTVMITNPSHRIFDSLSAGSLQMLNGTTYWTPTSTATTLATYSSYPVITERAKGAGFIYLLGFDFYLVDNTTWGRVLANCIVKNISGTGGLITVDTASGSIKAGSCKNVTLTFHREKMIPGTQVVPLRITHNAFLDPNPVVVLCTLSVDSTTMSYTAPSMAVTLFTGDTAVKNVAIQNTGSSILNFSVAKISKGPVAQSVLINEVCTYGTWIELVNAGNSDVNIGGWRLVWTDNSGSSGTYYIPAGSMLKSHRLAVFSDGTSASNDSLYFMGNYLNWSYTTELSVSLLNASGQGVDFFKTSGDPTLPPAGTSWSGPGFIRSGSVYDYSRLSTVDNNTASDWSAALSSGGISIYALNPGEFFTGGTTGGYISARADSLTIGGGSRSLIRFKYDASSLMTNGIFIDTFQITHNAKTVASPITVVCTLVVKSNIPVLIPYVPDPTVNRRPILAWHPVASASAYIIEIAQNPGFTSLQVIQQTVDTFFRPLVGLPLGDTYWRVRSDLNAKPSLADHFFIQSDSIPVLIPIQPDTIPPQAGTLFAWHTSAGAASYKIQIYKIDSVVAQATVITFTNDTFYRHAVPLASGCYVWMVSADFDYNRLSYPDTFWVKTPLGIAGGVHGKLPLVFDVKAHASAGRLMISCSVPQHGLQSSRPVTVDMFDVQGRLISKVFDGMLAAGYYQFAVPVEHVASGMYFCRMRSLSEQKLTPVYMKK